MIILKGRVPHTTHSFTKKKKKLVEKEIQQVLNKGKSKLVLSCLIISRGEGEGVLNKFLYGEAPPEVQPLTFLYTIFQEKGTPFV